MDLKGPKVQQLNIHSSTLDPNLGPTHIYSINSLPSQTPFRHLFDDSNAHQFAMVADREASSVGTLGVGMHCLRSPETFVVEKLPHAFAKTYYQKIILSKEESNPQLGDLQWWIWYLVIRINMLFRGWGCLCNL